MLGVVFTGGDRPSPQIVRQILDKKEAFFVAADSGLIAAEEAGIKPSFIIGDMDSLDLSRLAFYPPENVIRHEHEKDHTDTELAISLVQEKGCEEIWIIGGGGGERIEHLFAIRALFEREIFPSRWITNGADIRSVDAEIHEKTLSCSLKKDALVSVFPLGTGPWEAKSAGLKWPLEGVHWDHGFSGLSNVAQSGDFSITAEQGRFMVILPL